MTNHTSFRDMGCRIGSKVRFVDDPPDTTRTIKTEKQLDEKYTLPWIVLKDHTHD